jgi:two-component system OmpR family response regulator
VSDRPLQRLLVVEDDRDIVNLVTLVLGEVAGYTVQACSSAREAVEVAGSFAPDLILLDVMMPGTDGIATLGKLRRLPATRETPFVFMTAMATPGDLARYEALGCLGVIPKPFDPTTLAQRLESFWGRTARKPLKSGRFDFEALRREYVGELPGRIAAMEAAAEAIATGGWDRETVEALYRETHRLTGSSGLYRMSQLSRTAATLEETVKVLLTSPTWPPTSSPVELTALVKAVDRTAHSEARLAPPTSRET